MGAEISRARTSKVRLGQSRIVTICVPVALAFALVQNFTVEAQGPAQAAKPETNLPVTAPVPAPSTSNNLSDEYRISPDDVLDIYVYDVPELSHSYTVSPSGTVTVPLLADPLRAAGLTPDQFAHGMEEAFRHSGRLRRPEIAVSIKQSRTLSVTVDGAVRNPQVLTEVARTRLVDILTQCGGLTDDAGTSVTITRGPFALRDLNQWGEPATAASTLELKRVMDGRDPASATTIWPGDRVSVARAGVYYVLGEVRSPGGFTLKNGRNGLTVLQALALAGDVTGVAKKNKAMIIRNDPTAPKGREEIKLDLDRILAGHSPDPTLQANDILFVPGSGGKKALHTLTGVPATALGQAGAAAIIVH
jgi:polysaccharide biosynthesis/export protein